ncbi:MAG: hypothetical protein H7175_11260, partial [Burkholderiales bacterium]|nr:hypothetical protein [Anaerolineae bacterium]
MVIMSTMPTTPKNNNGTEQTETAASQTSNANGAALDTPLSQGDLLPEALKSALSGGLNDPERLRRYAERLLYHAFDQRDTDAAKIIAQRMDADPELDAAIADILNTQLQVQPDTVYLFVRARLSSGLDARWLNRLRAAALFSLRVAINDGDPETILNWLKLIAREPANYGMTDILHQGILAAQPRAQRSGVLGQALLALSVKRDPAALEILLNDTALLTALPDPLRYALTDADGSKSDDAALTLLETSGPELFLLALAQAAKHGKGTLFTPEAVDQLWSLYSSGSCVHLNEAYRPIAIINDCIEDGADWLPTETLRALLTLMLTSGEVTEKSNELLRELIHNLRDYAEVTDLLESALQSALESGERTPNDALDLVGGLLAAGNITEHQAVDVYVGLLAALDWDAESLPLMEQLARTVLQEPDVEISRDVQWRLLRAASELKVELLAKVASKRLLAELDAVEDEAELCEHLMRLFNKLQWNSHLR